MLWLGIVMGYMWYTVHCFLCLFCQMLFCFRSACYNIEPARYINWLLCDNALSARNFLASNMCCSGLEYNKPLTYNCYALTRHCHRLVCKTVFFVFYMYYQLLFCLEWACYNINWVLCHKLSGGTKWCNYPFPSPLVFLPSPLALSVSPFSC